MNLATYFHLLPTMKTRHALSPCRYSILWRGLRFFFYLETNRETTIVISSTTTIIKARSCLNVRNNPNISVISSFRREADERCALRGYNAANSGKELPPYAAYNRGTHPVVPLEESHFPISCLLLFRNSVWWCRSVRMLYPCIFIVVHFFHN